MDGNDDRCECQLECLFEYLDVVAKWAYRIGLALIVGTIAFLLLISAIY